MLILGWVSVGIARTIERSTLGLGFAQRSATTKKRPKPRACRRCGLKLIATTLSGALMGMAGAPLPYYVTYLDPSSSFNLAYAVNSVAMPADRRHDQLDRSGDRRDPARHDPAGRDRDDLIGAEPVDRRAAPDPLRHHRPERHRRAGRRRGGGGGPGRDRRRPPTDSGARSLCRQRGGQAVRRVRRARKHRAQRRAGERLGLIGPNGSGKSTLVNCLCGTLHNETGSVTFDGQSARRADSPSAHPPRAGAQLSAAEAVPHPQPRRQSAGPAALYRQCAPGPSAVARRGREPAATSCCARSGSATRRAGCRAI